MPRITLDLNQADDRAKVNAVWRTAPGFVPGEPNQGLTAELGESPARLPDYDDSKWDVSENIREVLSKGFTFRWWRIAIELPETIDGVAVAGSTIAFETTIDDYGELWVDGEIDLVNGAVAGWNKHQRVIVTQSAVPGTRHAIACLGANGPLAKPIGGVWFRYATLAFESRG